MIDEIDGNKEKKFKSMNNRTFFLFPEAHNWLQSFIPLLKLLAEYCFTIPYMYSTVLWSSGRQEKLNEVPSQALYFWTDKRNKTYTYNEKT
jgi:hypothetical protein